jgi:hypothetical protein
VSDAPAPGSGVDPWARIEARRLERVHLDRFLAIGNRVEFGVFCAAVLLLAVPGVDQVGLFVLAMVAAISALAGHGLRRWVASFSDGAWDAFYAALVRALPLRRFR